ncbi:hypothetical protein QG053_04735 [Kingella kingae]|uniref:hypothetical protein n=1 Tax=Kingella kingae TaxID=504 RepID=UPI00254EAC76|nr:hypothetical protein [Kingella kingae]MDK4529089.1 hypothetical protein [Kingella kingae]MDK4564359.1 hypothetical protein [Kingella kingae]MDK4579061.1 hypothetical protein [Kingella kingae]MDK4609462.1 hypothetical protein [Kingella kingae]MDK4627400.1 hypothetical protein [Kingella kingae]
MKPIPPTYSLFFDELESKRQEINSLLDQYDETKDNETKRTIFIYLQYKLQKLYEIKNDIIFLEEKHNVEISTEQDFQVLSSLQSELLADLQRISTELNEEIFLLG